MDDSIKDFTVNWIIGGLLMFCLLAFAISFMYYNNPNGLNDGTGDIFASDRNTFSNKLTESKDNSNTLLNVTANTNPEVSTLGSRDSVAVGYGIKGTGTSFWESSKKLLSFVFSGESGQILLGTIGGIIGFLSLYFIWRFIKLGQ
jgi:hypothetical protein